MTRSTLTLLAVAGLAVAGCGSKKSSSSNPAPLTQTPAATSAAPASTSTTSPSSSGAAVEVTMKDIKFAPGTATAKVGQKVVWTNDDQVDHNVTATGGADFKSDDFGNGKTYEFTPTKAGTIKYTCTLHPGMDGTLTVTG
jgi:plastocyanin